MNKKMKSALTVMLTLALVSATAVAYTWATTYDGKQLNTKNNIFTDANDIAVNQMEPWWDKKGKNDAAYTFGSNEFSANELSALGVANSTDVPQGSTTAAKYSPNLLIPKNPQIYNKNTKNASDQNDGAEYVAMRVIYELINPKSETYNLTTGSPTEWEAHTDVTGDKNTSGDNFKFTMTWAQFKKLAQTYSEYNTPGFNTTDWTVLTAEGESYYYNNVVYANGWTDGSSNDIAVTSPLFKFVKINSLSGIAGDDGVLTKVEDGTEHTSKYRFQVTRIKADGTTEEITIYTDKLPDFKVSLQSFAIDANVAEFKSSNDVQNLSDLSSTPKTNATGALSALVNKAKIGV